MFRRAGFSSKLFAATGGAAMLEWMRVALGAAKSLKVLGLGGISPFVFRLLFSSFGFIIVDLGWVVNSC